MIPGYRTNRNPRGEGVKKKALLLFFLCGRRVEKGEGGVERGEEAASDKHI